MSEDTNTKEDLIKLKREFMRSIFHVRKMSFQILERFVLGEPQGIAFDLDSAASNLSGAISIYKQMATTFNKTEEERKDDDVHTEHCCLVCGCKYGDDYKDEDGFIACSVVSKRKKQSYPCTGEGHGG